MAMTGMVFLQIAHRTRTSGTADMPGPSTCCGSAPSSMTILTGTRWTTFTSLPVAFSGGKRLKRAPLPAWMLSTCPVKTPSGYASTRDGRGLPASHVAELRHLEVRHHPPAVGHDREQRLAHLPVRPRPDRL